MNQQDALLQLMGTVLGEVKQMDSMMVEGSDNLRPSSDTLRKTIVKQLESPSIGRAVNQQVIPAAPTHAPGGAGEQLIEQPKIDFPAPPSFESQTVRPAPDYSHVVYKTAQTPVNVNPDFTWFAIEILKRLDIISEKLDGQKTIRKKKSARRVSRSNPES